MRARSALAILSAVLMLGATHALAAEGMGSHSLQASHGLQVEQLAAADGAQDPQQKDATKKRSSKGSSKKRASKRHSSKRKHSSKKSSSKKGKKQKHKSNKSSKQNSSGGSSKKGHIFGDWGGLRPWLSNHGITLDLSYLSEFAWDVSGGRARGGTYAGQEELKAKFDWDKIANLNGASTHVDFVSRQGRNLSSDYVGDVLVQSQEIYGAPFIENKWIHLVYLYQEQKLFGGKVTLKAGRLPVMSDFGTLPTGCDFMSLTICANRGMDINLGWTVFPMATWGGMAEFKISNPLSFKIGAYEVNPDLSGPYGFHWSTDDAKGVNIPMELDWKQSIGPQQLPGIYKIGGSIDTSQYDDWYTATNGMPIPLTSAPPKTSQRGSFYILAQQMIWKHDYGSGSNSNSDSDPSLQPGVTLLGGFDYNTTDVSVFKYFAFLGVLDKAPFPSRPDDRAGFQVAYGRVSPELTDVQQLQTSLGLPLSNGAPGVETSEWVLEANYDIKLYRGLHVMPDLQYIIRPSGAETYPNALVAGFQIKADF